MHRYVEVSVLHYVVLQRCYILTYCNSSTMHTIHIMLKLVRSYYIYMRLLWDQTNIWFVIQVRSHNYFLNCITTYGRIPNRGSITLTQVFETLCTPVGLLKEQHTPLHRFGCQKVCKRNTIDCVVIIVTVMCARGMLARHA